MISFCDIGLRVKLMISFCDIFFCDHKTLCFYLAFSREGEISPKSFEKK